MPNWTRIVFKHSGRFRLDWGTTALGHTILAMTSWSKYHHNYSLKTVDKHKRATQKDQQEAWMYKIGKELLAKGFFTLG